MVGSRKRHARVIDAGTRQGFRCRLTEPRREQDVLAALPESRAMIAAIDCAALGEARLAQAFDPLEHDVRQHCRIIGLVYATGLRVPPSWTERYSV